MDAYGLSRRGMYLGLTVLLRAVGLPLLSPLRGLLEAFLFLGDWAAGTTAWLAGKLGAPIPVRVALEGYRDRGLEGISPHLDYRR